MHPKYGKQAVGVLESLADLYQELEMIPQLNETLALLLENLTNDRTLMHSSPKLFQKTTRTALRLAQISENQSQQLSLCSFILKTCILNLSNPASSIQEFEPTNSLRNDSRKLDLSERELKFLNMSQKVPEILLLSTKEDCESFKPLRQDSNPQASIPEQAQGPLKLHGWASPEVPFHALSILASEATKDPKNDGYTLMMYMRMLELLKMRPDNPVFNTDSSLPLKLRLDSSWSWTAKNGMVFEEALLCNFIGVIYNRAGNPVTAKRYWNSSIDLCNRNISDAPSSKSAQKRHKYHSEILIASLCNLATVHSELDEISEARKLFGDALEVAELVGDITATSLCKDGLDRIGKSNKVNAN